MNDKLENMEITKEMLDSLSIEELVDLKVSVDSALM